MLFLEKTETAWNVILVGSHIPAKTRLRFSFVRDFGEGKKAQMRC